MIKKIWDAVYREEYYGLKNTRIDYEKLKHKIKVVPTIAISTIKFDEHGEPKHAKYRIVVLGHLDQNKWS